IVLLSCSKDSPTPTPTPTPPPTIEAPGKATLSTPENNKACEELNSAGQVSFSWNASTETDSYDLKITNLNNQQQINQNNITTNSKAVTLTKGIPYSWNITSKNKGDKTTTSDTWQFYLAGDGEVNFAPFPALPISPAPGSQVTPTDGAITLAWSGSDADGDALSYTIEMDTTDGLQGTVVAENTTETSVSVTVTADTIYYWRIITSDGFNSATSIVYSFRVIL
ncbi:MAG: hypothetical protein HWD80_03460, partial [Flavobacteriaceae bacterium]|nr:hypothetical protein [Flavobacteriaceae bacterium]